MQTYKKGFLMITILIAISGSAMALIGVRNHPLSVTSSMGDPTSDGLVSISAELVQGKVLTGSDGKVSIALNMTAAVLDEQADRHKQAMDLVVVLDRSGSMGGQKIRDARLAVKQLLDRLSPDDRFALVTYANGVQTNSSLVSMDAAHHQQLVAAVDQVSVGGGTNLGGGLQRGIDILIQTPGHNRQRKVILISDGLANQGVTDPGALGTMAASGVEYNFGLSAVGVGYDFNEVLMTALADHGAGQYYFLENPQAFAQVFEKEFNTTRLVAAGGVEIRIPLKDGVRLTQAGGFPIKLDGDVAVIHPGNLQSGQSRKLFLTFQVPTHQEREFKLGHILMRYQHKAQTRTLSRDHGLVVACVADHQQVVASIDEAEWTQHVLQEDYSRLKDEVADAVRQGKKEDALSKIQSYETRNRRLNSVIQSESVSQNLDQDVQSIRSSVRATFIGKPAEVAEKKKKQAKILQYESYQSRRDKK